MLNLRYSLVAFVVALVATTPSRAAEPASKFTPEQVLFYEKEVKPVLVQHCLKCHGDDPKKLRGGLSLLSRKSVLAGGDSGPVVDLKKPTESMLLKAIGYSNDDKSQNMPPNGKLPAKELATLKKWVETGLPWSPGKDDGVTEIKPVHGPDKNYWAYQRVKRPEVPKTNDVTWGKTAIDAFVLAKLESKGLKPVGPASKIALIRRAYYDLTGLPPSPEQIDAFVKESSPQAYEKLIDRLLESSQYGEKWGRHWLDVVRYAETNGYERDGPKPYAWRYRDYVIRSLNDDKPYDQFIREQLAGDELDPNNPDAVIATGFYRLGIWDDEPADGEQALYDGYDDYVTVVGQGFLGMTLNCCRCHDHKGDFFPQTDYYRMLAFFRDIRPYSENRDVRSSANMTDISPLEKRKVYEAELKERQGKIEKLNEQMVKIENAAIKKMPAEDQRASEGLDRPQVVRKVPMFLDAKGKEEYASVKRDIEILKKKPNPVQDFALSVNNCDPNPPTTKVMIRGNPHSPGAAVQPGFPGVLGFPDPTIPAPAKGAKTSGRRTVLANGIASPENPLTARVMMNRVWQYHFGKGLVPTSSDFGKFGEGVTHPELLDYLASEFVAGGWKLKRMHKLLMMSQVYQQSAASLEANMKMDPANTLYWRFNMRRLAAEEVRDSILLASGNLNTKMFGPSVYPKIPAAVLAGQSVPGQGWPVSPKDEGNRRSVYVHIKRSLQVPILITHDQADTDSSCPVRYTTTVPTQALGMLNGEFTNEQANAFATRLEKEAPGELSQQIAIGIRLTCGRAPTAAEINRDKDYIQRMIDQHKLDPSTALRRYTLLLLNMNEFVYLD